MYCASSPFGRAFLLFFFFLVMALTVMGAEKARIKAQDYVIDTEIFPKTHHLTAHAKVKFTALDDVNFATFELNNGLRPTRVVDVKGKGQTDERISCDNGGRGVFRAGLVRVPTTARTVDYIGTLATA